MGAAKKKKAPAGAEAPIGSLTGPGARVTLPDGRLARLSWPTHCRVTEAVDGWFVRESRNGKREGEPEWFAADTVVKVEPTPIVEAVKPEAGTEIDPLLALVEDLPLWEERE